MQAPGVRLNCVETRISGSEVRQGALSVLATLLCRNEICVDVESYVFHFKVFSSCDFVFTVCELLFCVIVLIINKLTEKSPFILRKLNSGVLSIIHSYLLGLIHHSMRRLEESK